MQIQTTDEQLAERIRTAIARRGDCENLSNPNLIFRPTLESCDSRERTATYRVHTFPWMSNPMGVLHGGMTAAILDTFMGILCRAVYGTEVITPTISMTVNYARPIPLDADLIVCARVTHTGGTSSHTAGELRLADAPDDVLATATGVYYIARQH
ncbi:MAG: PaaI family thioesterase [Candidatus Enterenecus sp.]